MAAPTPPGQFNPQEWVRVLDESGKPDSSRAMVNIHTGDELSRRQFDARRRETGALGPIQSAGPMRQYNRLVEAYADEYKLTKGQARQTGEFKLAIRELRRANEQEARDKKAGRDTGYLNAAHGPRAMALEAIGIRKPGADYKVGDTPKQDQHGGWRK